MKKIYRILTLLLGFMIGCSSDDSPAPDPIIDDGPGFEITTAIADSAFEQALIDLNLDDQIDGLVVTSDIDEVTELILDNKGITDLTGINDFKDLENLV